MKTLLYIQFGFAVLFAVLTVAFLQESGSIGGLPKLKPGEDHCSRGPGYWCYNETTEEECNKVEWCKDNKPLGNEPCTWGPSYWCYNKTTEKQCNAQRYCRRNKRPCLWGPTYWCRNATTESQCNKQEFCANAGKNPCTWGPSYWCHNKTTELQCNATTYCSRPQPPVNDQCRIGPEHWCENLNNAFKCGIQALVYCLRHGGIKKEKPKDPCLWGPEYWCANTRNALRCNAFDYCEQHGWNITKSIDALFPKLPQLPKKGSKLQKRP